MLHSIYIHLIEILQAIHCAMIQDDLFMWVKELGSVNIAAEKRQKLNWSREQECSDL